jgi:hypothetical protein
MPQELSPLTELCPNKQTPEDLEMLKGLSRRIHLIVIFAARKGGQFPYILSKPWSRTRQKHTTALKLRRLGMQADDFVALRRRLKGLNSEHAFVSQILD